MNFYDCKGVKLSLAVYLYKLGVSQSGAHKDHSVIQVSQTLSNGCLLVKRDTETAQYLRPHK